jgi:hypothetical protein
MLTVDDEGTAHLVYTKSYTDHHEFYYAHTTSKGDWTVPANMGFSPTPWNTVEQFTSGAGGRIHLVWVEMDQTTFPWQCAVKYIGKVRSGDWTVPRILSHDCASRGAVAADKFGRAHVVWNYDGKLYYTYQSPQGDFSVPMVADDTEPFHSFDESLTIAVDSLGGRHVAWDFGEGNIWASGISGTLAVTEVVTEAGGTINSFSGDSMAEFPPGAVAENVIVSHTPQSKSVSGGMKALITFDLSAELASDGTSVISFDKPYTITTYYTDVEIVGLKEDSLALYWWNNTAWEKVNSSIVDTTNNQVSASLDHLTQFAVFGESGMTVYYLNLPVISIGNLP